MTDKLAILFAGQGSQQKGMGLDIIQSYPYLRRLMDEADEILQLNLQNLLESEDGPLNKTVFAQPAIFFTSILLYNALLEEQKTDISAAAGFSLGEYSALHAAGVFTYRETLELIKARASAMDEASVNHPGSMLAVLGFDKDKTYDLCHKISSEGDLVTVANLNCPGQIVVSGTLQGLMKFSIEAAGLGARRLIPVNVSGAFHSPLMEEASKKLGEELTKYQPKNPSFPVYMNADARKLDIKDARKLMKKQVVSPVRFEDTLRQMQQDGVTHFLEIGPGTVISGFVKKTIPDSNVEHLSSILDMNRVKGWLKEYGFSK